MISNSKREAVKMLALVLAGVVATFVLLTMPVFVAGMVDSFGLGDKAMGWLASADMAGGAIACLLVLPVIARLEWRTAARVAIACAVAGNVLSILAGGFASLMMIRLMTGFANGIVLAIVFVGLCHSRNPDRYFGIYVFTQLSLQVALLAIFPRVFASSGMQGIYLVLAGASALSFLLVFRFPESIRQLEAHGTRRPVASRYRLQPPRGWAVVALLAQALYFLAPAAIWGYLEPIGGEFALDIGQVAYALSIASIAGIGGAAAVVILGTRFDRIHSMATGVLLSLAAVLIWLFGSGFGWYLAAAALFSYAWNYTFPYQMGVLALFDEAGNVAMLSLMVQLAGLAFGPMLASLLVVGEGYDSILWASLACYIGSFVMFAAANRQQPKVAGATGAN